MTKRSAFLSLPDAIAARLGLLDRPIHAADLIEAARHRAGAGDFGDCDIVTPLERLLSSCAEEARLSIVGRLATRWDVIRFLVNLLRLRQEEVRDPAITAEVIDRPIFITGLPRSGTTFLHRLLMQDARNAAPLVYQMTYPYPPPARPGRGTEDRRIALVARQLRMFERLAPDFRALHPLDATSPQECSEITAHVFASLRFDSNYDIPSYRDWLDETGHLPAYRFHKRFLQHLQHQDRQLDDGQRLGASRRWVLKCPDHIFALDAIRTVYPDAGIVFVHRDPVKVLASVARLTEVIRAPFTRAIDPVQLGRQESARWREGTARMIEAAGAQGFAAPICHVWYTDLVADPSQTIQGIYDHFGLRLAGDVKQRIGTMVDQAPNGGYGARHYKLADHGLDADAERGKFAAYMAAFGIAPETPSARREAAAGRADNRRADAPADHDASTVRR